MSETRMRTRKERSSDRSRRVEGWLGFRGFPDDRVTDGQADDDDEAADNCRDGGLLAVEERDPNRVKNRLDEGDEACFGALDVAQAASKEKVGEGELDGAHDEEEGKVLGVDVM